jgi:hypothetical protein
MSWQGPRTSGKARDGHSFRNRGMLPQVAAERKSTSRAFDHLQPRIIGTAQVTNRRKAARRHFPVARQDSQLAEEYPRRPVGHIWAAVVQEIVMSCLSSVGKAAV